MSLLFCPNFTANFFVHDLITQNKQQGNLRLFKKLMVIAIYMTDSSKF